VAIKNYIRRWEKWYLFWSRNWICSFNRRVPVKT